MAFSGNICPKNFPKKSKIEIHVKRNHKCNLCLEEFSSMEELKRHKKINCEKYILLKQQCPNRGKIFDHIGTLRVAPSRR